MSRITPLFEWGKVMAHGPEAEVEVFMPTREKRVNWAAKLPEPREKHLTRNELVTLGCPKELIPLVLELRTPQLIQSYIREHFTYDEADHTPTMQGIVKSELANCFTGTFGFAYPLLRLHGYSAWIVMMVADNARDPNHNIVVYRDKKTGLLASVGMSAWDELMDRPHPIYGKSREPYRSTRTLIMDYWAEYTSLYKKYVGQHTLIGYSDPIIPESFDQGLAYAFEPGLHSEGLEKIYKSFTEDLMCTYLFDPKIRFIYPEARNHDNNEEPRKKFHKK